MLQIYPQNSVISVFFFFFPPSFFLFVLALFGLPKIHDDHSKLNVPPSTPEKHFIHQREGRKRHLRRRLSRHSLPGRRKPGDRARELPRCQPQTVRADAQRLRACAQPPLPCTRTHTKAHACTHAGAAHPHHKCDSSSYWST